MQFFRYRRTAKYIRCLVNSVHCSCPSHQKVMFFNYLFMFIRDATYVPKYIHGSGNNVFSSTHEGKVSKTQIKIRFILYYSFILFRITLYQPIKLIIPDWKIKDFPINDLNDTPLKSIGSQAWFLQKMHYAHVA